MVRRSDTCIRENLDAHFTWVDNVMIPLRIKMIIRLIEVTEITQPPYVPEVIASLV